MTVAVNLGWSAPTQRRGQEAAVVVADLAGEQAVQELVLAQDELAVGADVHGKIDHLVGIGLEVEQLEVVVADELLECRGRVEIVRRVVARELVAAVEAEADEAARRRVGPKLREGRHEAALTQVAGGAYHVE